MLLRSTPSRDFSDLQLPLTAVAADVTTGHHVELNSGDLISALMASTAIPGVFPVVEREGLRLVDGGILYNVPISIAAEQGAQTIVVLDCGFNLSPLEQNRHFRTRYCGPRQSWRPLKSGAIC